MLFEFATATRIVFGDGVLRDVGKLAGPLGGRALVVTGSTAKRAAPLLAHLKKSGVMSVTFSVPGEPTIETVRQGVAFAHENTCDLVIGFGGGSVIDAAKAISVLLTNTGDPLDYLEVIGKGRPLLKAAVPYIAIPTTAGTGAEVTRNAVLLSSEERVKVSLRSPLMLPRVALVDPRLTHSMSPELTATTGLDALAQLLEPYVSPYSNPITDALCREGLMRVALSLRYVYENGDDEDGREDMALASLLGGLALANANLGAVHGFAGPLGGMLPAPHGALCGCLLPHVMAVNVKALQERDPESEALTRYHDVACILSGKFDAQLEDGQAWVQSLCADFKVPGLSSYGFTTEHIPDVIEKAAQSSSMRGNSIELSAAEMREVLSLAM